jgi:thiol:disulfide interchange protein DsbD
MKAKGTFVRRSSLSDGALQEIGLAGKRTSMWLRLASALLMLACCIGSVRAADDFLEPERAFRFAARTLDARTVEVTFRIAPGYYMYREQFRFAAADAQLGPAELPEGKVKFDETFQKHVETYRDELRIRIPVLQAQPAFRLDVTSQGCADRGLCYPPMQSAAQVALSGFGGDGTVRVVAVSQDAALGIAPAAGATVAVNTASPTDAAALGTALQSGRFWSIVGVFFVAGVLLSLTPCVLPMLPILSAVIVGYGSTVSRGRGLALAASYSLGMALVYTLLGIGAGLAGEGLAAALQNAWVLGAFAVGLVALALSMFGVYELRLPQAVTGRLTQASTRLPAGRMASVFAMGGVSALLVSPCVAAPLAGALVYLSQTRDVALGGSALFSLAAGMSVPLLLLGASAGALLPRVGAWMDTVKRVFGMLLLVVALWTVQPLLPGSLTLALWGALLLASAFVLRPLRPAAGRNLGSWGGRFIALLLGVLGVLQLVGAASGGTDPLQPLGHLTARDSTSSLQFTTVRTPSELDAALRSAGRPVMVDFYADWCVSCKEMERFTFSDATVRERLGRAALLKIDVTKNNADDLALLRRFGLFGPPGTLFFDPAGREIAAARVIGFQTRERFLETLSTAGL